MASLIRELPARDVTVSRGDDRRDVTDRRSVLAASRFGICGYRFNEF